MPFLDSFSGLIDSLGGTEAQQVANAHLIFNVSCAAIFLLLIKPFSRFIQDIMPQKDGEIDFITRHISNNMPDDISEAAELVEKEIAALAPEKDAAKLAKKTLDNAGIKNDEKGTKALFFISQAQIKVLAQLAEAEQALETAFERWEYLEGLKNGA